MEKAVVLVVEDDAELLELAESTLEAAGLRVVTATDGKRALSAVELIPFDAIILDMMMPELDGLAFLREHGQRPGRRAPVVAVSGFGPYLQEARELGAVDVLTKPYRPRHLVDAVRGAVTGRATTTAKATTRAEDEATRLRALFELRLNEPAPEAGMQRFLDEIAAVFAVPVSGISAVTEDRQQLVTHCTAIAGDPGGPRKDAFCTHAVAARAALVIQDALENPLFRSNPTVTVRGFRFYAGVPLVAARGEAVGTLCILDYKPHEFTHFDLELLGLFARRVLAAFEWRDRRAHPGVPESAYRYLHEIDQQLDIYGRALFADLVIVENSRAMLHGAATALVVASLPEDELQDAVDALRSHVDGGIIGRLGRNSIGVLVRGMHTGDAEETVRVACGDDAVVLGTDLDSYAGGATGLALVHLEQALAAAPAAMSRL